MNKNRKAVEWLLSGETGISSEAILSVCLGVRNKRGWFDYPLDSGDFGRCVGLLDAIPEIRKTFFRRMPRRSPQWKALVEKWDELEAMYRGGDGRGVTWRIRKLTGGAE